MFLTEAELKRLTGYTRAADQRKWMKRNGWKFEPDRNGRPVVLRDYAISRWGGEVATPEFTPDYSAIR